MKIVAFVKKHATAILIVVLLLSLGLNALFVNQGIYEGKYYFISFAKEKVRIYDFDESTYTAYTVDIGANEDSFGRYNPTVFEFGAWFELTYEDNWNETKSISLMEIDEKKMNREEEIDDRYIKTYSPFHLQVITDEGNITAYACLEAIAVQAIWAIVDIVIIVALIKKAVRFFKRFKIVPKGTAEQ